MKDDMKLWQDMSFLPVGDEQFHFDAASLGAAALIKNALIQGSHVSAYVRSGNVKQEAFEEDEAPMPLAQKYFDYMKDLGGRLIFNDISTSNVDATFVWNDGVADISVGGGCVCITAYSQNEDMIKSMRTYFDRQWAPPETTGHIYAIVNSGGRLSLTSVGNAGIPLEDGNYTPKVMEDYKFMVNDLRSETPSGRIAIMRGIAGTGKTHLIRALLLEVPDAMFVLVSPDLATNLGGPELLPLLMQYHAQSTGPIVLVIEDADKCLVSRGEGNMNAVQSLLNLGDGILGSLLDIRIVATTNADEFKMDAAITRPGRLSKMLDVGNLDYETARGVFKRLLSNVDLPKELNIEYDSMQLGMHSSHSAVHHMSARAALKKEADKDVASFKMTLAEVYALARKHGWTSAPRKAEEPKPEDEGEDADWF